MGNSTVSLAMIGVVYRENGKISTRERIRTRNGSGSMAYAP